MTSSPITLIAYGEWCQIHDLQRREFCFGTKDMDFVTQSFMQQKFYYSEKGIEKASDRHQQGAKCAPLTSLGGVLYNFSIGYQP